MVAMQETLAVLPSVSNIRTCNLRGPPWQFHLAKQDMKLYKVNSIDVDTRKNSAMRLLF